jgi:hypothetical protein
MSITKGIAALPAASAERGLSAASLAQFAEEGFLILRGIMPPQTLAAVADDLEARLALREGALGIKTPVAGAAPELEARMKALSGRLLALEAVAPEEQGVLYEAMTHAPSLHRCAAEPALLAAIRSLLSPTVAVHHRLLLLMSLPERSWHLSAWHQDHFYNGGPTSTLTVWMPLHETGPAVGSLLLARGSHRRGSLPHGEHDHGYRTKWLSLSPADVASFTDLVSVEAKAGDIVVFSSVLAHSARMNRSDRVRFTVNLRYQDLSDPQFIRDGWRVGDLKEARSALGRLAPAAS